MPRRLFGEDDGLERSNQVVTGITLTLIRVYIYFWWGFMQLFLTTPMILMWIPFFKAVFSHSTPGCVQRNSSFFSRLHYIGISIV
jgi:hypothetical protein